MRREIGGSAGGPGVGFAGPSSQPHGPMTDDEFLPVVYVGSLPPNCDDAMLQAHFAQHATPLSVKVFEHRRV